MLGTACVICLPILLIRIATARKKSKPARTSAMKARLPRSPVTATSPDRQGELVRNARTKAPTADILAQIRSLVT